MAVMIPEYIDQENPKLNGERMIFDLLADKKVEGYALHSLLQNNHRKKIVAEIDFLYISKRGLLCLEVKGGQSISRKAGQWFSTSRNGTEYMIKDPFRQANDCMFALRDYLIDTFGKNSREASFLTGYGVLFPECIFTGHGNDLISEIIYDCKWNMENLSGYLKKTYDYWDTLIEKKLFRKPVLLSENDMNRMVTLLRGDFFVVPSLKINFQHIEKQINELTQEQYDAIEITSINDRVIVQGGAGTGKSLLAIEKAKKMISANKKIAYICFNKNMAKVARKSLEEHNDNNSFVGTYHGFARVITGTNDHYKMDVGKVGQVIIDSQKEPEIYDYLIIDEGQDLMNVKVWDSFDKILFGGLNAGKWVVFLDPNQNIFNNTEEYTFALDYIKEAFNPAIIPLTKNCRNTQQIGRRTAFVTSTPPAKHLKVTGPKVVTLSYKKDAEMVKILKFELSSLLSGGTPVEDIVLLSRYKKAKSNLSQKDELCGFPLNECDDIELFQKRAINYFTVHSFKGLESKVVFLVDADGFVSDSSRFINYVGMTRAKILLYLLYPEYLKDEYVEITTKSLEFY